MIVLPIDPSLAADGRRCEQREQRRARRQRPGRRELVDTQLPNVTQILGLARRPLIERRLIGQRTIRYFGDHGGTVLHAQQTVGRDFADLHGMQIPFVEHALDFSFAAALHDEQHALLRF